LNNITLQPPVHRYVRSVLTAIFCFVTITALLFLLSHYPQCPHSFILGSEHNLFRKSFLLYSFPSRTDFMDSLSLLLTF